MSEDVVDDKHGLDCWRRHHECCVKRAFELQLVLLRADALFKRALEELPESTRLHYDIRVWRRETGRG